MQFIGMPNFFTNPFSFLSNISVTNLKYFILLGFLVLASIIAIILSFHWRKYGLGEKVFVFMEIIFIIVSVVFLGVAWLNI